MRVFLDTNVLLAALLKPDGVCASVVAVRALKARFAVTNPEEITITVCRDPNDNALLAAAHAGQADCLVTGDKDLLTLGVFEGVAIISPSSFHAFEQSRPADE